MCERLYRMHPGTNTTRCPMRLTDLPRASVREPPSATLRTRWPHNTATWHRGTTKQRHGLVDTRDLPPSNYRGWSWVVVGGRYWPLVMEVLMVLRKNDCNYSAGSPDDWGTDVKYICEITSCCGGWIVGLRFGIVKHCVENRQSAYFIFA